MRGGKHAETTRSCILVGMDRVGGSYIVQADDNRRYLVRNHIKFYELEHIYRGVVSGRITIDRSTQTDAISPLYDLIGAVRDAGDDAAYDPWSPSPNSLPYTGGSTAAESTGTRSDPRPHRRDPRPPSGRTRQAQLRDSIEAAADSDALALVQCLTSVAHSTHMPETVPPILYAMQPTTLVNTASGRYVQVNGPQGVYQIMHPKSASHAATLPEAAQWAAKIQEHHVKLHGGPNPFLRAAPRRVAEGIGEKIHRDVW